MNWLKGVAGVRLRSWPARSPGSLDRADKENN